VDDGTLAADVRQSRRTVTIGIEVPESQGYTLLISIATARIAVV